MKHTPGPWTIKINRTMYDDLFLYDILAPNPDHDKTGVPFSGKHLGVTSGLDNMGDAHLIAAAPDLLDACRWAFNQLNWAYKADDIETCQDRLYVAIPKHKSAIAKAEGE